MIRVFLTPQENMKCKQMGYDTVQICEGQNAQARINPLKEKRSRRDSNFLGFKGEYAFSKLFELSPTDVTEDADDGIDYVLPDNRTVDVKATGRMEGDLIMDSFDSFRADIAVLCYTTEKRSCVDFYGWINKEEFMGLCKEKDYGHGMRKYAESNQLHDIEYLLNVYELKGVTI